MADATTGAGSNYRTPPYVAFKTFNTLIADLHEHGIPTQIDRSVLRRFSGGVGSQLLSALKSLNLVNDEGQPLDGLAGLVLHYGSDNYKIAVGDMIHSGYPYLNSLDLLTATPSQFADAFRVSGAKEDVLRKARTFFLHAAQYAGLPIGSRLLTSPAPRKVAGGARKAKSAAVKPKIVATVGSASSSSQMATGGSLGMGKALEYQLIDLMKEPGIGQEESDAIWTLVRFLTVKNKGG